MNRIQKILDSIPRGQRRYRKPEIRMHEATRRCKLDEITTTELGKIATKWHGAETVYQLAVVALRGRRG